MTENCVRYLRSAPERPPVPDECRLIGTSPERGAARDRRGGCRTDHVVLLIALLALVLTGRPAGAEPYDDFAGTAIDAERWEIDGNGFSQPGDGYLHFAATGPTSQTVTSKRLFASGVLMMPFRDYSCDNNAPAGRGLGSIAGFGLGDKAAGSWVRLERGQIRPDLRHGITGGYIEVNWVDPGEPGNPIHVNWLQSEIAAGFLQIRYDGRRVTFFYREKPTDAWSPVLETNRTGQPVGPRSGRPLVLTPGWTAPVPLFVNALPGGSESDHYRLAFKIGPIDVSPVPALGLRLRTNLSAR